MARFHANRYSTGRRLFAFLVSLMGIVLLGTVNAHDEKVDVLCEKEGTSDTPLSDLPNGIFSLMDYSDTRLNEIGAIQVVYDSDTDPGTKTKKDLLIDGFERFSVATPDVDTDDEHEAQKKEVALTLTSLNLYLIDSEYHTLQLFQAHNHTTGKDEYHMSLHDGDSTHAMLNPGPNKNHGRRRLGCSKCSLSRFSQCKYCIRDVKNLGKKVSSLEGTIKSLTGSLDYWKDAYKKMKEAKKYVEDKFDSLADVIDSKVVRPIDNAVGKAEEDLQEIDDIANNLAKKAVKQIKKLHFLPTTDELLDWLYGALKSIFQDFCVPYNCVAGKVGLDSLEDIELYKSGRLSLSTSIVPETCLGISEVEFDPKGIKNFIKLFGNLDALEGIFDEVTTFLEAEMKKILSITDEIDGFLEEIEDLADGAVEAILGKDGKSKSKDEKKNEKKRKIPNHGKIVGKKFKKGKWGKRHLLANTTETVELVTEDEAVMIAYEKGREMATRELQKHVKKVFKERQLSKTASDYFIFKKFKLELSQDFGQTFTLKAQDRTGYAGSLFNEALHQEAIHPITLTGGLVSIVTSGSMEGKMPYSMAIDGEATIGFGYGMGKATLGIDLVDGKITTTKEEFDTKLDVQASVGASATMSLDFAASASLGVCLGPGKDSCVFLTIDTSQSSAAGFDALAGVNVDKPLKPMYTDLLEYKNKKDCSGDLMVGAGYWQYVQEPKARISITGPECCTAGEDHTLFEVGEKGNMLHDLTYDWCFAMDVPVV